MDFAEQERRPEQIAIPEYQSFSAEGSEENSMFSGSGVDYSKVPKALQGSPIFGSLAAPPQEKVQGQSNENVPVTKTGERSDSAPLGGTVVPPILLAGGLGGALPAPKNPLQSAAEAFGKGAATFGRGAAALGGLSRLGAVGVGAALLLGGPFAQTTGGAKEVEWMRRNAKRRQQILQSTSDAKGEDEASAKKKKKKKAKATGKERATDVPSWSKGQKPREGESGEDFAKRLLNEKYGPGNYRTRTNTEYSKLKKHGDRYSK